MLYIFVAAFYRFNIYVDTTSIYIVLCPFFDHFFKVIIFLNNVQDIILLVLYSTYNDEEKNEKSSPGAWTKNF